MKTLYHVLNRGVDKRTLFLDEHDCVRFIHDLYVFNDRAPADANNGHWFSSRDSNMDIVSPYINERKRERLVEVHGCCLVGNHYHLLVSELAENGLSLFLRKLNVGYAKYFNERYKRSGTLFQGRTKKVLIKNEAQFLYILHYIHLNALDLLPGAQKWRERDKDGIRNRREALEHLEKFRWSSYLDYIGKKNFPSVFTTRFFNEAYGNYKQAIADYLRDAEEDFGAELTLE